MKKLDKLDKKLTELELIWKDYQLKSTDENSGNLSIDEEPVIDSDISTQWNKVLEGNMSLPDWKRYLIQKGYGKMRCLYPKRRF
jgi:hypothetical protein